MQASDTKGFVLSLTEREELRQKIRSLLENRKEILFAYLHGTFRVGKNFRDIDLALYVNVREISALDYELAFEVLLQDTFNYPFDVRLLNNCPTSFAYQVIRDGERIYVADDDQRATFEEGVLSRYLDFLPYHKQYLSDGYGITV
jgi:predicted nucleotidyltransferase